jgi:hypothetical protein
MQDTAFSRLAMIIVAGLLVAGCAANNKLTKEEESGYLGDSASYADLKESKDPLGNTVFRFVDPAFNPKNYNALMIAPLVFYPRPEPTDQLTTETMDQIRDYSNQALRKALEEKVQVVDQPGPGVARVEIAFTAVVPQKEGLATYQYIPLAFVATMGTRAVTGTPENTRIATEGKVIDSVSGKPLMKAVRIGTGENLEKLRGQRMVTLESVKPVLDSWIKGVADNAGNYVKAK